MMVGACYFPSSSIGKDNKNTYRCSSDGLCSYVVELLEILWNGG